MLDFVGNLVIPRFAKDKDAILCVDVFTIEEQQIIPTLKKISEVSTRWNRDTIQNCSNNCQNFISDVLGSNGLNLILKFPSPIQHYIKNISKGQQYFFLFQSKYGKDILLNTHSDLDSYVKMNWDEYQNDPNMFLFFKGLDRAFWKRHFHNPSDEVYACDSCKNNCVDEHSKGVKECTCPFGDPYEESMNPDIFSFKLDYI